MGRNVALGLLLALSLLLLGAARAEAGKYTVAQCGWYAGADASWADTTGGAKFRPDAFCVPPGGDPFAGVHVKSLTRDGQETVSGTRFARWRWTAPLGAGITAVRGTWWHALHDGIEQRLGVDAGSGFESFLSASATDTALREFSKGFPAPVSAFEDRLLCARAESKWCSLEQGSWSALRGLTITVEDDHAPDVGIGGELLSGGWRRGNEDVAIWSADLGGGVRFAESFLDGIRIGSTEHACAKALISGEWRGTAMRPCPNEAMVNQSVDTAVFGDGLHQALACATDFAENRRCTSSYTVRIDNNPPVHPKAVSLAGGEEWRRVNDFDLGWENPDQGAASPIAGASWRLVGDAGHDSGVRFAAGRDRRSLANLSVPAAGSYSLQLWLRDEAGNEAPSSAVTVPLRLDDVSPELAFATEQPGGQMVAEVADAHSGPDNGQILYRRVDQEHWTELPTKLVSDDLGKADLVAPMPDLGTGTFVFRADAADAAGNTASTSLRADGTQMTVRRVPPPRVPKAKSRLFARLRGGHGRGDSLTVPFGAPALVSGRLTRATDGAGITDREVRIVSRPSRGALVPIAAAAVRTGEQGGFELRLPPGPSRRVTVSFAGDGGLEPARRPGLELRVRSGVSLRVGPSNLRTGQALRLAGKVKTWGAPIPRRGKLVAIQYLEQATHRWRPVLVTRSDHHGRFHAHYRFRYVSGLAAIRLRATALAEERWPYAPGSSSPLTIHVKGS
ncbi:MAG TPA: hypothetical protein VNC16_02895 [Solirubrobacterales bacterium]|jgi:hypothetical protein|nr:hypothetical protein [Solirubrobacterales bacterium]